MEEIAKNYPFLVKNFLAKPQKMLYNNYVINKGENE
jgi:hypothetical protein